MTERFYQSIGMLPRAAVWAGRPDAASGQRGAGLAGFFRGNCLLGAIEIRSDQDRGELGEGVFNPRLRK